MQEIATSPVMEIETEALDAALSPEASKALGLVEELNPINEQHLTRAAYPSETQVAIGRFLDARSRVLN